MNKNILYIALAIIIGLGAGWLIFGNGSSDTMANKDISDMSDQHDHSGESADQMWTCSMHPQIMQPEAGDCPICGMDLIPVESSADGLAMDEIKMTENAMALANIQTTIVGNAEKSDDDGMISLSGKIAANEENKTVQASYFKGRIERLNVNYEGQQVNRGQLLATIYAPDLVAAQQELITAVSLKESQPALYQAVRNKLKNWKLSDVQINAIEESGKVRENFPIYATVSGTVSEVMAAQGDYVNQGQPIVKLSNLNSVWAEFDAYENQIAQFSVGQKINITTNAYPNKKFEGTISFIDPVLNNATRTVTVRATLQNRDDLFKPGMFVTGKVKGVTQTMESSLAVPASAVLWTGERSLVYVKTNPNEPVFEMREVTLGNRSGETYQVSSGLNNGDEIVTNGTFTVDAAAQLQGKKSMMNQQIMPDESAMMRDMEMSFSNAFSSAFKEVLPSYLKMKDALVASNAVKVSAFAKATSKKLKEISTSDLGKMEKQHLTKGIEMLDAIANNDMLENQRSHFVILNENIVPIAMSVQNLNNYFIQKCPMANNNKGAVWLSTEEEIKNPYYGDAMLTCGSVIESL
ncbi:efflux RND transporter periplasmic adaptor subunit [Nonlabens marinus]|uniref:Probable Co/Zn/Cd efflux system membrane fusion protein n=1 Tax=Nonlabens marinus S1-08 TaxID=1454201 RepID=W8VR63_9FLAO|nr:efflux RND transporter periplasmic adaptor subunit [Nonlabens marinus]BAO56104.1 probable Co/Zn/Cd efflux system membrane fusion protein [Nonlabens marinus S1-08]